MINGTSRVLVTGASGLLGRYLLRAAPDNYSVTPTYFSNNVFGGNAYCMNITDAHAVMYIVDRVKPDIIVHCAALGSVDYCEDNPGHAKCVNIGGTANVLKAAEMCRAKVVYISTNAVFRGDAAPYIEHDERHPVNMYGVTKKAAEDLVFEYKYDWMIVRPIMLYGWPFRGGRGNWVTRFIEFFGAGMPLKLVDDTRTQPTYAGAAAEAIWKILRDDFKRIIHVGGYDKVNLCEFAKKFCDIWGLDSLVEPVSSGYFKNLAPRPMDTTYYLATMNECGITPERLCVGLRRMWNE